jgi:hypothetical protein
MGPILRANITCQRFSKIKVCNGGQAISVGPRIRSLATGGLVAKLLASSLGTELK